MTGTTKGKGNIKIPTLVSVCLLGGCGQVVIARRPDCHQQDVHCIAMAFFLCRCRFALLVPSSPCNTLVRTSSTMNCTFHATHTMMFRQLEVR